MDDKLRDQFIDIFNNIDDYFLLEDNTISIGFWLIRRVDKGRVLIRDSAMKLIQELLKMGIEVVDQDNFNSIESQEPKVVTGGVKMKNPESFSISELRKNISQKYDIDMTSFCKLLTYLNKNLPGGHSIQEWGTMPIDLSLEIVKIQGFEFKSDLKRSIKFYLTFKDQIIPNNCVDKQLFGLVFHPNREFLLSLWKEVFGNSPFLLNKNKKWKVIIPG